MSLSSFANGKVWISRQQMQCKAIRCNLLIILCISGLIRILHIDQGGIFPNVPQCNMANLMGKMKSDIGGILRILSEQNCVTPMNANCHRAHTFRHKREDSQVNDRDPDTPEKS